MDDHQTLADTKFLRELPPLPVKIYVNGMLIHSLELKDSLEFGRQNIHADPPEPPPWARVGEGNRVIIARDDQTTISRRYLQLSRLTKTGVHVTNLSSVNPVAVGQEPIPPETGKVEKLPFSVQLAQGIMIRVEPGTEGAELLGSRAPAAPPGSRDASLENFFRSNRSHDEVTYLLQGLHATLGVFQRAATSSDFMTNAAQAVIDIVGLDSAATLTCRDDQWKVEARAGRAVADHHWMPSQTILEKVRAAGETHRQIPRELPVTGSLQDVVALVAAPILNPQGNVVGALYGDRHQGHAGPDLLEISEVEGMLVELVASSVASGLARLEYQQEALRARVQFEQFFSPKLARELEAHPDLLESRDMEVTLLFCDIRNFSRITELRGPKPTLKWINEVLGLLSDQIIARDGVLVDYVGDELLAMWGAPDPNPDHANLACQAAIEMVRQLPALSERWRKELGEPTRVGIGISTGVARVGNVGSERKFKYGALGNTVNVGSRVQDATKDVQAEVLITGATARGLGPEFATRRICVARLANIAEPIPLYELAADSDSDSWDELKELYERALDEYEASNYLAANRVLGRLLADHPDDGPTLQLLSRVTIAMSDPAEFDPVWKLGGK